MVRQNRLENQEITASDELDPWSLFIYAMKVPMTRDRYQTRVAKFFEFSGIAGSTVEEKARNLVKRGRDDTNWTFNTIMKFTYFQKERVDRKEITGATVRNYVKSIKLFCEMADISGSPSGSSNIIGLYHMEHQTSKKISEFYDQITNANKSRKEEKLDANTGRKDSLTILNEKMIWTATISFC